LPATKRAQLKDPHERDAGADQEEADDPPRGDRMLLEPHPAEVLDDQRGDRLPRDDDGDERNRAEARPRDDAGEDVERS
jgi:hypothetical protein